MSSPVLKYAALTHHLPALAWTLLVVWLLTMSGDRRVDSWILGWVGTWSSIASHFVLFGVLALLWARSLDALGVIRALPLAVVLAALFGVGMEVVQSFVPGRESEGLDMVVNGLGAATFAWLWGRR